MEIALRPAGGLWKAHLRRQDLDRLESVLTRQRIQLLTGGIENDERTTDVGVVCSGDKNDTIRAWDTPWLKAGVDTLSIISKEDAGIRPIRIADPKSVEVGRRAIHVVPAGIDDSPIGE